MFEKNVPVDATCGCSPGRVLFILHSSRSLRRFLPEVFPRDTTQAATEARKDGDAAAVAVAGDAGSGGGGATPKSRYGSTFRRLYGHAAFSLVAALCRNCAGALKGPPLRDLVEACFEEIACRPVTTSAGGSGGGGSRRGTSGGRAESEERARSKPHPELTAFAVMHASDLLQCCSEV